MKFLLIIVTVVLVGCGSLGTTTKNAIELDSDIRSGEVKEAILSVNLTQVEEEIVTHALNAVASFRDKYGKFIRNPGTLMAFKEDDLISDYQNLRVRYDEVVYIVAKNFDSYPIEVQNKLVKYQNQANILDVGASHLMKGKKYREAIREIAKYGFLTLQLVATLKP